jgi:hypothetical protein
MISVLRVRERKSGDAKQRYFREKSGCAARETTRRRHTAAPGRSEAAGRAVRSYCAARVPRHGSLSFWSKERRFGNEALPPSKLSRQRISGDALFA